MIAIFLTIIFPGLGHLYYGKYVKGAIIAGISLIPMLYPLAMVGALIDVYRITRKDPSPELSRREAMLVIAMSILLPLTFFITFGLYGPRLRSNAMHRIRNVDSVDRNTKRMEEISQALERYYSINKHYPENLAEIIRDNPVRRKWEEDVFGNAYLYATNELRVAYSLRSLGKDGINGTDDDAIMETGGESR